MVVTCAEAEGDQRRSRSVVVNHSYQAIELRSVRSLISSPDYAESKCGASRIAPGEHVICISPWVAVKRPWSTDAGVFSLVEAVDAQGRFASHVSHLHATF
jgi:hypothetical protein